MTDPNVLPPDLPVPTDDGAADHLPGMTLPSIALPSTAGGAVSLDGLGRERPRTVLYVYPMTGKPGVATPDGWDAIPGARGCTPEACAFRDHHADLAAAGADVCGLSTQSTADQAEAAERLHLPFPLLSDQDTLLAQPPLQLPTFEAGGRPRYRRLTLVIADGRIEHVFYPVFPPDTHASEVLAWLQFGKRKSP
ncbi:MAG: peroxiredoxin [Acidimicrobiia bacterium]